MIYGDDAVGAMLRRVRLLETDDTGTQQKVKVRGFRNDEPEGVVTLERWGETGVAPPGAEAVMLSLGGRSDRAVILGFAHQDHRVKNSQPGDKVLYDANGNVISLVQAEIRVKAATKLVLQVGGITFEMTSAGITITGGSIKHDGKSIDKTHVHGGIVPGSSNTLVPAN